MEGSGGHWSSWGATLRVMSTKTPPTHITEGITIGFFLLGDISLPETEATVADDRKTSFVLTKVLPPNQL